MLTPFVRLMLTTAETHAVAVRLMPAALRLMLVLVRLMLSPLRLMLFTMSSMCLRGRRGMCLTPRRGMCLKRLGVPFLEAVRNPVRRLLLGPYGAGVGVTLVRPHGGLRAASTATLRFVIMHECSARLVRE